MLPSQRALFDIPVYNDEQDVDRFIAELRGLLARGYHGA